MECAQKSETKRKRTTDFTENVKKQGGWRERDTELDKQRTTTLLDEDDNTGGEVESSRCSLADGNPVSKADKEVVDPEADPKRDQRTVYVSGIPLRASREEVNIFFSSVCKVRNIDLLLDPSLRVPNAVGYIEFDDPIYVSMAVDLSGQLLLGQPIEVKPLNVGNPAAEERSYFHTGKKNFLDKPWDMMTSDERIDASTNWRELTDVENRRFYYNKLTGDRDWSLPLELLVARNRAHFAAQSNPFSTQHVPFTPFVAHSNCQQVARNRAHFAAQSNPFSTQHVPFTPFVAHSNCQQVFGAPSQVAPWPQYSAYPLPQYSAYPLPQYSAYPLPQYPAYPWPQYQFQVSPSSGVAM